MSDENHYVSQEPEDLRQAALGAAIVFGGVVGGMALAMNEVNAKQPPQKPATIITHELPPKPKYDTKSFVARLKEEEEPKLQPSHMGYI